MGIESTNYLKDAIDDFLSVFRHHLEFVYSAHLPKYEKLYKKTICIGVIDSLSKTVFPYEKSNRTRFVKFVEEFSRDYIWNKVSLSHLIRLLNLAHDPALDDLSNYALRVIGNPDFTSMEPLATSVDPDYEEVRTLWPSKIKNISGTSLEHLTHKHLFYNYRNYVIHEMRRTGGFMDDDITHKNPFYYSSLHLDDGENYWTLVYPLGFHVRICEVILKNIEEFYLLKHIDPFKTFDNGYYFLPSLNRSVSTEVSR